MKKINKSTVGGLVVAEEMKQQRRWWRHLRHITENLESVSKQGPTGAALAEQVARGLLSPYENSVKAVTFLGELLGHRQLLQIVSSALGLDQHPNEYQQIDNLETLWLAAQREAAYFVRGKVWFPPRDDYHPTLRRIWKGDETPMSLVLRVIARMPAIREQMGELGWELPEPSASAAEFENFFGDLCEAAAGPGLSASSASA